MSFAIIISEKGGAERREAFDKAEINVGRVQGNDLMLPKGNVSKHHARLLYRDGRFIVTDLKSTNGTYVNGRKIAQATIVREGDKIYIGDFVLRVETPEGLEDAPAGEDDSMRTLARAPAQPAQPAQATLKAQAQPANMPRAASPSGAMAAPRIDAVGSPPTGTGAATAVPYTPAASYGEAEDTRALEGAMARGVTLPLQPGARPAPPQRTSNIPPSPGQPRAVTRETPAQAARRLALITLVDRIADAVNLAALRTTVTVDEHLASQIEKAAHEQASAMAQEGEVSEGIDLDSLARDAHREFVSLGPLEGLLEDDDVSEIHCMRHDQIVSVRSSAGLSVADTSFTSEEALRRALMRLMHQAGVPWDAGETTIECRLARGGYLSLVVPPVASATAAYIRKRRRVEASLEDLIRAGTLSRPAALFLEMCLSARVPLLVSGPPGATMSAVIAALAAGGSAGERIAVVHDADEMAIANAQVAYFPLGGTAKPEAVIRAAAKLHCDRMIVAAVTTTGAVAGALDAIIDGAQGVIAGVHGFSLRQATSRMASQLVFAHPGMSSEAAHDAVYDAFEIGVELAAFPDGRHRIVRIAELSGRDAKTGPIRDVFLAGGEPSAPELVATGVVPRIAQEIAARGQRMDPNLFKRAMTTRS